MHAFGDSLVPRGAWLSCVPTRLVASVYFVDDSVVDDEPTEKVDVFIDFGFGVFCGAICQNGIRVGSIRRLRRISVVLVCRISRSTPPKKASAVSSGAPRRRHLRLEK